MKASYTTKSVLRSLALITVTIGFVACQPNSSSQAPGAIPGAATSAPAQGGSSGGGGYVSENSALLLEQSSQKLASMIRKSTPVIYGDLPKDWSAERLASVVEKVRSSPDKELRRDGKDLMFNYAVDADGTEYIEALKPFFHVYGSVPVKTQGPEQLRDLENDLMLKLLHETAHHMKLDEKTAEAFAQDKMLEMDLDVYSCISESTLEGVPLARLEPGIAIRRSTGEAFRFGSGFFVLSQPFNPNGEPLYGTNPLPVGPRVFSKVGRKIGGYLRRTEKQTDASMQFYFFAPNVTQTGSDSIKIESSRLVGTKPYHPDFSIDSNTVEIRFGNDEKTQFIESAVVTAKVREKKNGENGSSEMQESQKRGTLTCRWRADMGVTTLVTVP